MEIFPYRFLYKMKIKCNTKLMKKTVYISLKENIIVNNGSVKIKDIADVYCNDDDIANKIQKLEILHFNKEPNRAVVSITEIIRLIDDNVMDVEVDNLDNTSVIVQYKKKKESKLPIIEFCKVTLVCLIVFFGAAFAIMSFNEDVSTKDLFENVYTLFTGKESDGRTIIEVSYSLGLGFGIIILYGHFWKAKITNDPTPIEVEMSKYEKDIDSTIVSNSNKEGQ